MYKKISLFILFGLVFTLFAACGKTETETDFNFESDLKQLEGYECTVVQHESSDDVGYSITKDNPFGYPQGTVFADEVMAKFKSIEAETGCTMSLRSVVDDATLINASVALGNYEGEILFSASVSLITSLAKGSSLCALDEKDQLDLTDSSKWGHANILEVNSYAGHVYGLSPVLWPLKQPRVISVFMIDTQLTAANGLTNPHEYLENKTWSWDSVEEILRDYHIKDGEYELKALGTRMLDFVKLAVFGNGVKLVNVDADGNATTNVGDSAMYEAVSWVNNLYINYQDSFAQGAVTPAWATINEDFAARTSIAALIPTSMIYNSLIYAVEEYAILPFPTGPKGTYGEWPGVLEATDCFSILNSADEEDMAASVLNMLCEPFDSVPDYDALVDYYADNVFFSRNDAEVILSIGNNAQYSYWPDNGADTVFWHSLSNNIKNTDVSKNIERNKENFELFIQEYMIPNLEAYRITGELN